MKTLYNKIIQKVTPTPAETAAEKRIVEEISQKIKHMKGKHSHLEWCGSSARGTHLRGDRDLDLFIMYDKALTTEELEKEGLGAAKAVFRGHKWEKAYSQHPYIRGEIKGFEIELVPSYIVASGAEKQSAVDRTPFHNKYLLARLSEKQKNEARLLKQFLKGIGAYGADLKNCALPGYGAELLIVHYGTFEKTLRAMEKWNIETVIDFGTGNERAQKLFEKDHYPLIIVDPVDENRNVASALSLAQFERMVLAAKLFLKKPSEKFFFPKKEKPWSKKKIRFALKKRNLLAIKGKFPSGTLADLVWGQMRRFERKSVTHLHEMDYRVLRSELWSDEKDAAIIFELEEPTLPAAKKIRGPPASDEENAKRFLEKKRKLLSGPRIEDGRLVIEIERKEVSAHRTLEAFVGAQKKEEKKAIRDYLKSAQVLGEKKILAEYKGSFAEYLTRYLEGKEAFE